MSLLITLPRRYAEDRQGRGLGPDGEWTARGFRASYDDEALNELISDARYYGAPECGMDACPREVRVSATAAYRKLAGMGLI